MPGAEGQIDSQALKADVATYSRSCLDWNVRGVTKGAYSTLEYVSWHPGWHPTAIFRWLTIRNNHRCRLAVSPE